MYNKIESLLNQMLEYKYDAYIIPSTDEFLNEYVPSQNKRLLWITNFSGSNGIAIISRKKKILFTDGRYLLQARKELPKNFEIIDISLVNFNDYLKENFKKKKILLDTKLFKIDFLDRLIFNLKAVNSSITHDKVQIIDKLWVNRPVEEKYKIFQLSQKLSGCSTTKKISQILKIYSNMDFIIISSPESVCWLLNIRGKDLEHTPIVMSRMILSKKEVKIFIDKSKIQNKLYSSYNNFSFYEIELFENHLGKIPKFSNVYIDHELSYFHFKLLNKKSRKLKIGIDHCKLLKSEKNSVEIKSAKKNHEFDAISLINFFYWIDNLDFKKKITEYEASKKLEYFRKQNNNFFSPSFPTISAVGSNGSIIHYEPRKKSKVMTLGNLYLCDSGGQYYGATTDVTRTVFLGKNPNKIIKSLYTLVLIGHLNISMLKFPIGTRGHQIDSIARYPLWMKGLDYNHGTGHGVGSFLGVHEGPYNISKKFNKFPLKPGMIFSNEPGYYKNGKYGIRIENLILVVKSKVSGFLEFDTLTLYPYEIDLIDKSMLTKLQIKWINDYHAKIFKNLSPKIDKKTKFWLKLKTKKI
ncbi:MAG: Xaa-Pro aminopeptidase [Rickettsiales bacterium]|nr:Xaa-Pro aminopeptidase [Rickettsiales bacterium]